MWQWWMSEQSRARFTPEPSSVCAARQFVAGVVYDLDVDLDAVALLTSEVATNAVRHANTAFEVVVSPTSDAVRVEVVNDAPEILVIAKKPGPEGGRGTHILDALASRSGVRVVGAHKGVWFECQRSN